MSFVETTSSTSKDDVAVQRIQGFLADHYDDDIQRYNESKGTSVFIDWDVIKENDRDLARAIDNDPEEYLYQFELAIREYDSSIDGLGEATVRIQNHDNVIPIRDIRSRSVNQMVSVEGIISKATEVKPKLSKTVFTCPECGEEYTIIQTDEELDTPGYCNSDNCNNPKLTDEHISYSDTEMLDFQKIQVQEPPEDIDGGDNPQAIDVTILGDATGDVSPGDRVTATGVLRGKLVNAGNRGKKSVMQTYVEGVTVQREEQDYDELVITEDDVAEIENLSEEPDIYEKLAASIAPSIFGYEDEKLAIALQLFAGVTKHVDDGNTRLRGDLHILFVGDPGTGKSQIVRYVKQLSPRGVFTSGKGSSSAGLTAAAVRDSEFGGNDKWTLQAGALVLADKGIACVDELDKMRSEDRSALHEALEQQTVSVNKAGINATLKSRCSLLAAANPEEGRFDEYYSVPDQINLEPPLVSRFDLIFIVIDNPDEDHDAKLAEHILKTNRAGQRNAAGKDKLVPEDKDEDDVMQTIDTELFRKYVAYARKHTTPELTEDSEEIIRDFYVNLRKEGQEEADTIAITARKLESLVRLAEASARIRLSDTVDPQDAKRAIDITKYSLKQVGLDPDTGEYDIDMVETGSSKSQRQRKKGVRDLIRDICDEKKEDDDKPLAELDEILDRAEGIGLDRTKVEKDIKKMQRSGQLLEPKTGAYTIVD